MVTVNILGETLVTDYLNTWAIQNEVAGHKLVAHKTSIENVSECNILFITKENTQLLSEVLSQSLNKSVIIVTEEPGMTSQGADISFLYNVTSTEDSTLTYTYNINSIQAKNINVAIEFIGYGVGQQ